MIPSRTLVLLLIAPLCLGLAVTVDASMLWPMLAVDGAIVAAALLDAFLGRQRLIQVTRSVEPGVFSLGRPNVVRLEVRSLANRRLRLRVTDDLFEHAEASGLPLELELPPRGRVSASYKVVPQRRGQYGLGDHWVRYASPLGLWIRQLRIPGEDLVRVYPDVQAVRAYDLLAKHNRNEQMVRAAQLRGGESDFECLREYTRDDEFRAIDWRATASKRRLITRQYQLERNQTVVFALDCGRLMTAVTDGLPLFDHALNAALMLGHVAVKAGDNVGLFTFSDQVHSYVAPRCGPQVARRLVQATFATHPELRESNVPAAFGRVGAQLRKRSLVVLFTQVIDETSAHELLRTVSGLQPRHLPLCILFRDPDLGAVAAPQDERAASCYQAAAAAELLTARDKLIRALRRAGALVLDVPPHQLTASLISRYLDVKVRHLL
ncbi:MAG: DUF58 domain-containing protein [Nannocystaceae bacterium]|nr:DUF58 domain-containing protein [bacterium]